MFNPLQSSRVINVCPDGSTMYCRATSNATIQLEQKLSTAYQKNIHNRAINAKVVPSGMAAIVTILEALCNVYASSSRINIIYCDEIYCDVPKVCNKLRAKYAQVRIHSIDISDSTKVLNLFNELKGQTNILFIESCTNPSGFIMDYELIPKLRALSGKFYFIVDNTWLSHVIFNPFTIGADAVVLSLTKYYSGAKCIAGALLFGSHTLYGEIVTSAIDWCKYAGYHVSPESSNLICDAIDTIEQRITTSSQHALEAIAYVERHAKYGRIAELVHIGKDCHISHALANKYLHVALPPIFTLIVPMNYRTGKAIIKELQVSDSLRPYTSYGHEYTTVCPYIKQIKVAGVNHIRFRIYVGHDQTTEMIRACLDLLLSKF